MNTVIRSYILRPFALALAGSSYMQTFAENPAVTVKANANGNRHAISPLICGANWVDQVTLSDPNLSINRRGGKATATVMI